MRIHYRRRSKPQDQGTQYRANERIRVPEIRVIDEEGEMLGVMTTEKALAMARERELDLVEVSPKANPPVCKLIDYGAFKYQKDKEMRQQKAKAKKVEVKGIRLSVKMGDHDKNVRLVKALEFLKDKQKLKLEMILRGREKAHGDLAMQRIRDFIAELETHTPVYVEQDVKRQGGNVSAIVGPKTS